MDKTQRTEPSCSPAHWAYIEELPDKIHVPELVNQAEMLEFDKE